MPPPQLDPGGAAPQPRAQRARANTQFGTSVKKKGDPAPPAATPSTTSASNLPALDTLLAQLAPGNQPSLTSARQLALVLERADPTPAAARITPVLATLLAQDAPPALQIAGTDILAAYPSEQLGDLERGAWARFLLDVPWNLETAPSRLRALSKLTRAGAEVLGLERLLLDVIPAWTATALSERNAERHKFAESAAELLKEAIEKNRGLFSEDDLDSVLEALSTCISRALGEQSRRPPSPVASTVRPPMSRQTSHKRHPSSLSQVPSSGGFFDHAPHASIFIPAKIYLTFLGAFQPLTSASSTTVHLRVVCRLLATCMSPLPAVDVPHSELFKDSQTQLYDRITELLLQLLDSKLTTTVLRALKAHLADPVLGVGALRALRIPLRHFARRRIARARVSAETAATYSMSGAPTLPLADDQIELAAGWHSEGWDLAAVGASSALVQAARSWVDREAPERERFLEEVADLLADVAVEADARDSGWEDEERAVYGEVMLELARYVPKYRSSADENSAPPHPRLVLPLSPSDVSAPTRLLNSLTVLLRRPLDQRPPLEPPMSAILLSIPHNISDDAYFDILRHLRQTSALTPASVAWLDTFRTILDAATNSQRMQEAVHALRETHWYLRDNELQDERRELVQFVLEYWRSAPPPGAALHFLKNELVLEADPDAEKFAGLGEDVLRVILEATRGCDGSAHLHHDLHHPYAHSSPDIPSPPSTSTSSPSTISPPRDRAAGFGSIFGRFASGTPKTEREMRIDTGRASQMPAGGGGSVTSTAMPTPIGPPPSLGTPPAILPPPAPPPPPKPCRAQLACVALVDAFNELAFAPRPAHRLVIRLFKEFVALVRQHAMTCTPARLVVLSFLLRLRADRDHRVYELDGPRVDKDTKPLAALVGRDHSAAASVSASTPRAPLDDARGRATERGDAANSRSRSRAAAALHAPVPLWGVPEDVPFSPPGEGRTSDSVATHAPGGDVLPVSAYVAALAQMLSVNEEKDWDALSYVLCHLPAQLANKHFFCGPKTKKATAELLKALCTAIRADWYGAHLPAGYSLKARDANAVAYHVLVVLVSYRLSFDDRALLDALVETFVLGLVPHSPTAKPCLDALSLCVFELEASMTRLLSGIIDKLAQIMSNTAMAVHILDFLGFVASRPQLFANFTEDEYKIVFGVTLKYLQVHNRDDEEAAGRTAVRSWALSQHVLIYSYYVLYLWFLALPIPDRRVHIPFITRQLMLANEGKPQVDERTEVCFDWLSRYTYASADPKPSTSFLREHVMAPQDARVTEKTWLFPNSLLTIRAVDTSGWVELDSRRPSGRTCALMRLENIPLAGLGEFEPDLFCDIAFLMRNRDPEAMRAADFPADIEVQQVEDVDVLSALQIAPANTGPRPDPTEGYVWAGSAPSQRRKDVIVDPGYVALQISPYPEIWPSTRNVTNADGLDRLIRVLDNTPVIDTHAIGILYVAPGQSDEVEILSNQHGSPAYTRFLAGIGRLIRIQGQRDVYAGSLSAERDGEYAYAWWDDIGQILYHTATLMPNHDWDPLRSSKKSHIGNDAVRIVWNDSGLPYRFDTLLTEFQFVNIVVEPHSRGTVGAFSNNVHENEYFKITVQRADDMPVFDPVGEYKIIRAESLPLYVRQLSLLADFLSRVFIETNRDTNRYEFVTNWRRRLQSIRGFRSRLPQLSLPERQPGILGEQAKRDFTLFC